MDAAEQEIYGSAQREVWDSCDVTLFFEKAHDVPATLRSTQDLLGLPLDYR